MIERLLTGPRMSKIVRHNRVVYLCGQVRAIVGLFDRGENRDRQRVVDSDGLVADVIPALPRQARRYPRLKTPPRHGGRPH